MVGSYELKPNDIIRKGDKYNFIKNGSYIQRWYSCTSCIGRTYAEQRALVLANGGDMTWVLIIRRVGNLTTPRGNRCIK